MCRSEVKGDVGQPGLLEQRLEGTADEVALQDRRPYLGGEDKAPILPDLTEPQPFLGLAGAVAAERGHGHRGERYGAAGLRRLRFGEDGLLFAVHLEPLQLPAHREGAPVKVHVLPAEAEQFTLPEAADDGQDVECVQAVLFGGFEEASGFLGGKGAHLLFGHLRPVDGVGGVARDEAPSDGLSERPVKDGMAKADGVGKGLVHLLPVEALQVLRRELLERDGP